MSTVELLDTEMGGWPPGTRHYRTSDGVDLAVIAGADLSPVAREAINVFLADRDEELLEELPAGTAIPVEQAVNTPAHRVVPQPTAIVVCAENGQAITLEPLHSFPAGTTAAAALAAAGYEMSDA